MLSRVERNVAATLEQYAQLVNGGLTLGDNAKGVLLTATLTAPLVADLEFSLGKGGVEPAAVLLVLLRKSDGVRYSGGLVKWSWSATQSIGHLRVHALSSDVAAGSYEATFFVAGE